MSSSLPIQRNLIYGSIEHGPFETRDEAQAFIDSKVGAPEVRIVEIKNGKPVTNPFTGASAGAAEAAAPAPELAFSDKVARVAREANPPQELAPGFRGGSLVREYFKGWGERLKSAVNFAKAVARLREVSGVKDNIAARYDSIDNAAGLTARQAGNNVRLNLPAQSELADKAATFVRQANGDRAGMAAKLNAIRGKGFDDVIDYALKHWDSLEAASKAAQSHTDAVYNAENAAGIDFGYHQGYVKGVYENDLSINPKTLVIDQSGGGRGSGAKTHLASKVFNDYAEAIGAGYKPKDLRLSKLTESAVLNGMRLVNRQAWAEGLGAFTLPDGSPAVKPMDRVPAMDSDGNQTYRLRPPQGYKQINLGNGGSVIAVHEDVAPLMEKLTQSSHFPRLLSQGSASIKHSMLAFDIFHGSRFGQMQMAFEGIAHPSYHKGMALLEYSNGDLAKAVQNKEISQAEADWAKAKRPIVEAGVRNGLNASRISDALFRHASPILPGAKAANRFIFDKLSRGVITQSYVYAFERNAKLHPEMTSEQLHRYTAKEVNTYYRNLGNQGIFKSKTAQDAARFAFFAPQWIEGMVRSEARGYGQAGKAVINPLKSGNIAKGMGTGLAAYFAVNQLVNMLTRGQPTWMNKEPGHKLDAFVPDKIDGSPGYFISPDSVFAENLHDIRKNVSRGTALEDIPWELLKAKLAPAVHGVRALGGTDFYGRPLHGLDRVKEFAKDVLPIPLPLKNQGYAGSTERQLMAFGGVKATPASTQVSNIYNLANAWKKANNLKADAIPEPSDYAPLRKLLADGKMADAQQEYQLLRKTHSAPQINKAMFQNVNRPFAGSHVNEVKFRNSLTRDQMDLYNAALQEKQAVLRAYQMMPKQ